MPVDHQRDFIKTLIIFFAFLIFTAVFGTLSCGLWYGQLNMESLLTEGFQTDAFLENKYVDENNQYWFNYRFTTLTNDSYLSKITVSERIYNDYEEGMSISMHYLAENPEFNALDILTEDIQANSQPILQLSIFVIIFSIIIAIAWLRELSFTGLSRFLKFKG